MGTLTLSNFSQGTPSLLMIQGCSSIKEDRG